MKRTDEDNPPQRQTGATALRLTPAALAQALRAREPAARLVVPRILRRVILEHREVTAWGFRVPHRKSYAIASGPLLEIADREELGLTRDEPLPARMILLPSPDPALLAELPARDVLLRYWRLLFHARVHVAMDQRAAEGDLTASALRQRIHRIGPATFEEIREVLLQEGFLLPPRDDQEVYVEFAAVYLELRHFAPGLLPWYFPTVERFDRIDAVLAQDIDAQALYEATRPEGAAVPSGLPEPAPSDPWSARYEGGGILPDKPEPSGSARPSERKYRRLSTRAKRAAAVGNHVRAAMFCVKAERIAPRRLAGPARDAVRTDVDHMVRRLQDALDLDDSGPQPWRDSLAALVELAPRGMWTAEARLLYDLQKACADHEREIHASDLVEWVLSLGKRSIHRPLPSLRDVLLSKHLRSAQRRLPAVRITGNQRRHLADLIRAGIDRVETRIRQRFRPQIARVLDEVGLVPANLPERVARNKLLEELLDRIAERGFLTMGDFRDAISRNNLKLPDFARAADLLRGDQLLQVDRRLSAELDGVYHRGEFYRRWMQQLASLAFGTQIGRGLFRFVALPFVGAFVVLAFLQHALDEWIGLEGVEVKHWELVGGLGLFLLGLINLGPFRHGVWWIIRQVFRAGRLVLYDLPQWLLRRAWVRWLLQSRLVRFATRYVVKPLLLTAAAWLVLPKRDVEWRVSLGIAAAIFVAVNLLLNSRVGRNAEEIIADSIMQGWRRFGLRPLMALLSVVMEVSKVLLEGVERFIYAVDEMLRFRAGESNLTLGLKAAAGAAWFLVTYVFRFAINVVIEPQINPIKHFPVVTVSHKVFLPFVAVFQGWLASAMNEFTAWLVAFLISVSIPGVFGFLAWELKESWRLYGANRRRFLATVPIGPHGESMPRLLRRGFHSGTLPKRFARLRRAERRARAKANWKWVRRHLQALHHIERAVCHWVERELAALLHASPCWAGGPIAVDEVRLATTLIEIGLACPARGESPLKLTFEIRAGWLVAGIARPGWALNVPPQERPALTAALLGLYKSAGVEIIREQIEAELPRMADFTLTPETLVVWTDPDFEREVVYELDYGAWIPPQQTRGPRERRLPALERQRLLFGQYGIAWDRWVALWDRDLPSNGPVDDLLGSFQVVPEPAEPADEPREHAAHLGPL
jgi:hypothetical protein